MYRSGPAPTDQRPGVRPISFVLDDMGQLRSPVTLPIRPEDLTRTESSRLTVHQTMGRDVIGWVDHFGQALPTVNISGNTGWRYAAGVNLDGYGSFDALNQLVQHEYHRAKQAAVDGGKDPAGVKLLFVDVLDEFTYSVAPVQFVLRRSKSRPLLYQYQISLQAISTEIDKPAIDVPNYGNAGLAHDALVYSNNQIKANIADLVFKPGTTPAGFGSSVSGFVGVVTSAVDTVLGIVRGVKNFVNSVANKAISFARDLAQAGLNIFRAITSIANLPADIAAKARQIAAAFNQVACIFANALRPRTPYEQYEGLYGASNCSSTTGGRPPSPYAGLNVFERITPESPTGNITGSALFGIQALKSADPVLAPMPLPEIQRNADAVVKGMTA